MQLPRRHIPESRSLQSEQNENEFSIEKALRIYPTNEQVATHNVNVLLSYENNGTVVYRIKAQDQLIDVKQNLDSVILNDFNRTRGLLLELIRYWDRTLTYQKVYSTGIWVLLQKLPGHISAGTNYMPKTSRQSGWILVQMMYI